MQSVFHPKLLQNCLQISFMPKFVEKSDEQVKRV
jgi:hypothetical protein